MVPEYEVREFCTHRVTNTGLVWWHKRPNRLVKSKSGGGRYLAFKSNKKCCKVHRVVAELYCKNPCPDIFTAVDHVDENKLNNHWRNLRWVNKTLNNMNQGRGYYWCKSTTRWKVQVGGIYFTWFRREAAAKEYADKKKIEVFNMVYKQLTGLDNAGVGDEMYLS